MTGLAGIGYGLLRLAALARVPSVLTLEGPRSAQEDPWQ
jgi:lantibiotic modifying enzyme